MTATCKTCRHLHVPLDKAGRRVVRRGYLYQCRAPLPNLAATLPKSVTDQYWFKEAMREIVRHRSMSPDTTGCPVHAPMEEKA